MIVERETAFFTEHLKSWLDGEFSAADILMVLVLRRLDFSGLLDAYPDVTGYVVRGAARPAYQRAFAAQLAVFKARQGQAQKLPTSPIPR